jgi:hypothetical protein
MKYKIVLLVLLIVFLCKACNIVDDKPRTTFSFKNNTTDTLYNFYAHSRDLNSFWYGDYYIGTLPPMSKSEILETDGLLVYCSWYYDKDFYPDFEPYSVEYFSEGFSLQKETHNLFTITPETRAMGYAAWIENNLNYIMYDASIFCSPNDTTDFLYLWNVGNIAPGYRSLHFAIGDYFTLYKVAFKKSIPGEWFYADFTVSLSGKNPLVVAEQNIYQK